jgi:hypothetical protein
MRWFPLWLLAGCPAPAPEDTGPHEVPWAARRSRLADEIAHPRGLTPMRAITHLHSPYSHDACDDDGLIDGVVNEPCLQDLRRGLCDAAIDVAFLTDHPAHMAEFEYGDLWHPRDGDGVVEHDDAPVGGLVTCDGGGTSAWLPGFEDELMPLAMERHVAGTASERDDRYNRSDAETVGMLRDTGGLVFVAHTEGRDLADLQALQGAGLVGVELFNLHAAFAPDKREEDLGLDPYSWLGDIAPFTDEDGEAEPDLLFLAVHGEHTPSVAAWDALLRDGPMVGIAGTDAHQNVLRTVLRDGERVDSYRRMMIWFTNHVLADGTDALAVKAALAAGRSYAAFEVLGVPDGFDFHLERGGGVVEMGGSAPDGEIVLVCPKLSATSPRGPLDPEITATVFKDGVAWATGCGRHPTDGPGVYRARVDILPHHLEPFLLDTDGRFVRTYPWVYSNAVRVGLDGR